MDAQGELLAPSETIPQLQSVQSMQSANPDPKTDKQDNQQDGIELQVVQTKVGKGINHEEIMRMFNEQQQREEREREEIQKRRMEMRLKAKDAPKPVNKRTIIEEKKATREQALQQALSQKSSRIRKNIENICKKFHTMLRPSIYDSKFMRYRFQCKEKLFNNLCFGIEELKELQLNQLSEIQRELLNQDSYHFLKKLVTLIEGEMCKVLNKGDKNEVMREYKLQWDNLISNIRDESNFELKRKILCRTMDAHKIAIASEPEFFTQAKRQELLEKQKRYIAQFTVEKALSQPSMSAEVEEERRLPQPEIPKEQPPALKSQKSSSINRYIEQSSIAQIEQLLSGNQLTKMLLRLEQDLRGKSQSLLIKHFKETFRM